MSKDKSKQTFRFDYIFTLKWLCRENGFKEADFAGQFKKVFVNIDWFALFNNESWFYLVTNVDWYKEIKYCSISFNFGIFQFVLILLNIVIWLIYYKLI